MGERVYVVRHGTVRGAGAYYYDGTFGTNAKLAARLDEEAARRLVRTWPGRVVRLVTLSEQLRRAKKRIAELEAWAPHGLNEYAIQKMKAANDLAYNRGRADERAAVVGWLTGRGPHSPSGYTPPECGYVIEKGEHVKGAP